MKNRKFGKWNLLALTVLLATMLVCVLTGCSKNTKIEKLVVEGYKEDFFVGDTFETGPDFKVYAVYANGKREQITEGYTVKTEGDEQTLMYTLGDFMVTVEYGGKKAVYKVYVNSDDSVLKKLTVDTSGVKTQFKLGERFDFSGIRLTASYENTSGRTFDTVYTDTKMFNVTVTDKNGIISKNAFEEFGKHTIVLELDDFAATYDVNVEGVDLDSVYSAIYVAKYGFKSVNNGTLIMKDADGSADESRQTEFHYTFGNNYTFINETFNSTGELGYNREYHYSLSEDGQLVNATLENGKMITGNVYQPAAMNGAPIGLWWYESTEYGAESAIEALYEIGRTNPNQDFVEKVDAGKRTYSFDYSRKMKRTVDANATDYFFFIHVDFKLNESYAIEEATISQEFYLDYADEDGNSVKAFVTDENGHTTLTPEARTAWKNVVTMTQTTGERTLLNPYVQNNLVIEDFDLIYDGRVLNDGDIIYGNATEKKLIQIANIQPASASLEYDLMSFSGEGCVVYRSVGSDVINLTMTGHGEYILTVSTSKVTKTIKLVITGRAPERMDSQVYRAAFRGFYDTESVTTMIGKSVYFRAVPNADANDAFTAKLISGDAGAVVLKKDTVNDLDCWSLTASKGGTYTVLMTSEVAPEVTCKLTVTVVEVPDMNTALQGTYTVEDSEHGTYELSFLQDAGSAPLSGTLTVSYTAADGKKTETMKFTLNEQELFLVLEHQSGEELNIGVLVNEKGQLVMEDRYGLTYEMTR